MRILGFFKYLFLFVVLFSCFLIYTLPAAFVWGYLSPHVSNQLKQMRLDITNVAGTVWRGQVLLNYQGHNVLAGWHLEGSQLLSGKLGVVIDAKSSLGELHGEVFSNLNDHDVSIRSAKVFLGKVTPFISKTKVVLDGVFEAENVRLVLHEKEITDSMGLFSWSGGDISYPVGRQHHQRSLPPFEGIISWQDPNIHLGIRDDSSDFDVIEVMLSQAGMLRVSAKKRILDIAKENWPSSDGPRKSVFSIRRKIF